LGNGDVIAAGLFKFRPPEPRPAFITGASFHPPFS